MTFRMTIVPKRTRGDRFAAWVARTLHKVADRLFSPRLGCRAIALESLAMVPGRVANVLVRLGMRGDSEFLQAMIAEAENEALHKQVFLDIFPIGIVDRSLTGAITAAFSIFYGIAYLINPSFCHRLVGYLEEEACLSYTQFHTQIRQGRIEDIVISIRHENEWDLPLEPRLSDLVLAIRTDEARHRDFNHTVADET